VSFWIPVILTFATTTAVVLCAYHLATRKRREILQRINNHTRYPGLIQSRKRTVGHLKGLLRQISRIFAARGLAVRVEGKLIRAGIPLKGEEGITLWLLSIVVPALLVLVFLRDPALAMLVGVSGAIIPLVFVNGAINRRLSRFEAQIGSALIIIANSLRAGFSFLQALEMVSREMPDPIASEFRRVLREMNLGTPMEQALMNLSKRVGSSDLDLVVTAVLIQRQVGGNLAEVLDNISGTIRERIRVAGEVKTLTAQGRISGIIIGFLPVFLALILFLINREYIVTLFTDSRGLMLLAAGLVSQVLGLLFIKKIVDIRL